MNRALIRLSRAARRTLALSAVLSAASAVMLVGQALALATVLGEVAAGRVARLDVWLPVLASAVLGRALLGWASQVVATRAAAGAKEELRAELLDRARTLGPEWIATRGPAELTVLATRGLDALDGYFTSYLPALLNAAVLPLGVGVVILLADWPSAVLVALTLPLIPVFGILIGKHTRDRVNAAATATERLSGHLLELVRALPMLAAFRRAEAQADAVRRVSEAHRVASMATLRTVFASAFALELVATLSVALVAVGIGLRLVSGDLSLAVGLFVLILAPECYLPLRAVGAAHHAAEDGLAAVRRVSEVLDEDAVAPSGGSHRPGSLTEVSIVDLRVARRGGFAPDGLSLSVRPGEVVHLDAPSGGGKSTAFSVLLGFVPPAAGEVLVNGIPLAELDLAAWRRLIAWVPQRPAFTGGTVAGELTLGVADLGDARPEESREVAATVGIVGLLDRPVARLSVGERQRVAVARALLRVRHGARLLLLDEPTAHLDPDTAARVRAAIDAAAAGGAAVLLASHRPVAPGAGPESSPFSGAVDETGVGSLPSVPTRLRTLLSRRAVGGAVLGAVALSCGIALTATSAWLIAKAAQQPPVLTLAVAVVGVRTFGLARAGLRYAERLVTHDAAFRLAGSLRVGLWRALVRLGPARVLGLRRGSGLRRLVDDVHAVRDLTPRVLLPPLIACGVCLVAVAVQTAVLPIAGLALAVAVLVAGLGAPALAVAVDHRAVTALAAGRRRVGAGVLALLDGAAELIAFGAYRARRRALAAADAELAAQARREAFGAGAAGALVTLATGAAAVAGTWLAAAAVTTGALDPTLAPVLALVPLALAEVLGSLPPAAQQHGALAAAHRRVAGVLAEASRHPVPQGGTGGGPGIRLRGVQARWPGTAVPALRGVDLDVPPGTHAAVIGPSGAGKSTLLALLLGFLPPERGTASVPAAVAWCPQEPALVSTTVRENLRIADPDADDARLSECLRQAGLGHWASQLDTVLTAGGGGMSGGEGARLALARTLLAARDAELVLLDEPTAHLDPPLAGAVLRELRRTLAGRTVLHVTHRADEAADADLVLDLTGGTLRTRHPQPAELSTAKII